MSQYSLNDSHTAFLLRLGIAVPFLYYGLQLLGAFFYPGYSFISNVASELGSDRARYPLVFNVGIIVFGIITLVAGLGFLRALSRIKANPALSWLTSLAIAINGIQSVWAGCFPMPDPRHGGHPAFVLGMILLPFLLTVTLWKRIESRLAKGYFLATLLLLLGMVPVMSGALALDTATYRGLLQRLFTLSIFPPIGVSALLLLRLLNTSPEPESRMRPA